MGYHYRMNGEQLSPKENDCDSIWSFIFSSDSAFLPTVAKNFMQLCSKHERYLWPNLICVLNKGILSYASDTGLITDPRKAKSIYHSAEREAEHTLMKWFMLLCNDICNNHITAIDAVAYFKSRQTENVRYLL